MPDAGCNWGPLDIPVSFAEMGSYRLGYRDTGGQGETVIFLHALAGSGANWMPQFAAFRDAGFRCIAPDRRGCGESSPTLDCASDLISAAEDLEEIAECFGCERFHLVSIAGGGFVALDYAAWKPERLLSLTVAASTGKMSEPEIRAFSDRIAIPGLPWPSRYLEVGASYAGSNPQGLALWEEIYRFSRRQRAPEQPLRSPNTFKKIAGIDMPVLAIAGGGDLLAPPALMQIWTAHLPNCRFETVAPAGHSLNWEYGDAFNDIVLDFLKSQA